jgi:hypothetical protein
MCSFVLAGAARFERFLWRRRHLLKRKPQRMLQLVRAVGFVPASVREDDALGVPSEHGSDRRLKFRLVPPGEVQTQIAR